MCGHLNFLNSGSWPNLQTFSCLVPKRKIRGKPKCCSGQPSLLMKIYQVASNNIVRLWTGCCCWFKVCIQCEGGLNINNKMFCILTAPGRLFRILLVLCNIFCISPCLSCTVKIHPSYFQSTLTTHLRWFTTKHVPDRTSSYPAVPVV